MTDVTPMGVPTDRAGLGTSDAGEHARLLPCGRPTARRRNLGTPTLAVTRAGDGVVAVCAGDAGGQALALGLIDVVPVVFGKGKRYFGRADSQHLLEDPDIVIQGDRVLRLRFKTRR